MKTSKQHKAVSKTNKIKQPAIRVNVSSARRTKLILFGIILVTGLIYLKTSSFSFVSWDDDENITGNKNLTLNAENIKYHFENSRYKTLAIWSFMFDNYMFGDKAGRYHIHNVLLHLVNILLVFFLILRISKKENIAIIVAGLFALHPVCIEAVAWTSGRKDLLFVLFGLLAIFSYRYYLQRKQHIIWLLPVMAFVYIASLAKIQAFTLPLIFLGFDWYFRRKISVVLILEKIMLLAFIADKWLVFFVLSILVLIFYFFNERTLHIKKEKRTSLLFWYGFAFVFLVSFSFFILKAVVKGKIFFLIFPILLCLLIYLYVRRRKIVIPKLFILNSNGYNIAFFILSCTIAVFVIRARSFIIDSLNFGYWNNQVSDYFSFPERFLLAAKSLSLYLLRFFLISPQNPMIAYPQHAEDGSLPGWIYTNAVFIIIVIIAVVFILYKYARKNRIVILGALWFIASISIVLHFIPIQGRVIAADRYAYPSYIGMFLMLAIGIDYLFERFNKRNIWIIISVLFFLMCIKTYSNINIWKNSKTLWQAAVKVDPCNHFALSALSTACFKEDGDFKKALGYADQSIKLKPNHQYYNNRGKIKYYMYDFDGALEDFNNAILMDSSSFAAYNNRGAVYQQFGEFSKALQDYSKALSLKPDYFEAQDNEKKIIRLVAIDSIVLNESSISPADTAEAILLIKVQSQNYIKNKQYEKAMVYLTNGIKLIPSYLNFYEQLSYVYQIKKENEKALEVYNEGLNNLPDNSFLLLGRGILYYNKGDTTNAFADWRKSALLGNSKAQGMIRQYCKK